MNVADRLKWMSRRALKGAMVSVVLLSSYIAQAQCPEVSLEQCQADGYLQTRCGQAQLEACSQLIADAFGDIYYATPNEHLTVLPDSMGGDRQVTRFVPYSFSDQQVIGGQETYAGVVNKTQLISAKDAADFTPDDQRFFDMKQSWTQDGTTVNSCEEFVYKRYYDYSVFEDRWGSFVFDDGDRGTNYRAIFQAAVAPDGIANRELMSIDQVPIPFRLGGSPIPKNAYYTFQVGPYPNGYPRYPFDRVIIGQVDPRGLVFYWPTFNWHQQMSDRLSSFLDEELELRATEQKSFTQIMQGRRDLWDRYQIQRRQILREGGDPTPLDQQTATELFEIDRNLEDGLRNASRNGCFNLDQPTACDWSPRQFKEQLDAALLTPRENDFQKCVLLTGNDFGPDSFVHHAEVLGIPGFEGDYTRRPADLGDLLNAPVLLPIGEMRGWSRSGANGIGNEWFGVRYNYSIGAGLRDFWGPGSRVCDANAYINGAFNVDGTIVKQDMQVVRASADARTRPSDLYVTANLRIAGFDVYNLDQTYPLAFNINISPKRSGNLLNARYHFVLVVVPVTVEAGISGTVGLDFDVNGGVSRDCSAADQVDLTATGALKPYAELDANASAAVDVILASTGVRGTLALLHAALPLSESLRIYRHPLDPTRLMLNSSSALDFNIDSLSGKLTLFVRIRYLFGSRTFERKLFDWSGYHANAPLYHYSFDTDLSVLR